MLYRSTFKVQEQISNHARKYYLRKYSFLEIKKFEIVGKGGGHTMETWFYIHIYIYIYIQMYIRIHIQIYMCIYIYIPPLNIPTPTPAPDHRIKNLIDTSFRQLLLLMEIVRSTRCCGTNLGKESCCWIRLWSESIGPEQY